MKREKKRERENTHSPWRNCRERNLWADTPLARVLSEAGEWHLLGVRAKQQQLNAAIKRSIRVRKIDPLACFSRYDGDGDGALTHAEMQKCLEAMKVGFSPLDLAKLVAAIDREGKGVISWEVFVAAFPAVADAALLLGTRRVKEEEAAAAAQAMQWQEMYDEWGGARRCPPNKWVCEGCTFFNPKTCFYCDVCNRARPDLTTVRF